MKISELAETTGVTVDTLRYYEKQGLLDPPQRRDNGYRAYAASDVQRVRFVRGAQMLGFSLAQIREVIPDLVQGRMGRSGIEQRLQSKIAEIDARFEELRRLRQELVNTLASLTCSQSEPVSVSTSTYPRMRTAKPQKVRQRAAS
ncbi:MAG: MerR family transcriptional regulator [Ramlibacter sp.]|nr:MerR family transcriptional regulator [Ramlibacter sp.]